MIIWSNIAYRLEVKRKIFFVIEFGNISIQDYKITRLLMVKI